MTLFVVDAKAGLTPADETLAEMLRRRGKPVVLVANKSEARVPTPVSMMPSRSVLAILARSRPNTGRA